MELLKLRLELANGYVLLGHRRSLGRLKAVNSPSEMDRQVDVAIEQHFADSNFAQHASRSSNWHYCDRQPKPHFR